MPVASVGDQRWKQTGTEAGNRVFERDRSGGSKGGGYDEMTKEELQAELERRGLPTSGNKPELIDRLNEPQ